ncbi:LysR substrate-binding domain-containing protein [Isoptericola croceus]|uniref:LysR substrate-binding domain-containing protein n=1 Tax=Isoptericola croceus TaxID=3031406 RepID=UPI0023F7C5C6|nr:LysR substrate-binding domain-containing protein [Isoptericola croceus]
MSDDTRPAPGEPAPGDGGPGPQGGPRFRLGYVPGATPGRWARTWEERLPRVPLDLVQVDAAAVPAALRDGEVHAAIARLPVDKDELHAIPLYAELPVVVVSRDHLLAATEDSERVSAGDLADDVLWVPRDDVLFGTGVDRPGLRPEPYDDGTGARVEPEPDTTQDAIAWAATGSGVVVVPMSLARLHHRKDTVSRVVDGLSESPVGLVWLREGLADEVAELVEELVGIVRGRTANSSRGRGAPEARSTKKSKARAATEGRSGVGSGRGQGRSQGTRRGGPGGRGRSGNSRRGR